ncbi:hypothetical protein [Microbacterium deminutum]|uniref:Uncharacterized protein n=1 Tax=Microbacterium deminutum TaxID=344164 RepID=A0ABN2RJI8_9MICO
MSTPRRLFEDPRNTYIVRNDDPDAFDKRFAGRPGVHREQRCCRDRAPRWQPYLTHDGEDPSSDNREAYREMVGLQVEDATGESDNVTGRNQMKGYVWVEGSTSGYKPDFISAHEWLRWQGVYWMPSPKGPTAGTNPPRWVRIPGDRKVRWEAGNYVFLWCQKCETPLEAAWSDVLDTLPAIARAVAMVASYVPVFGTALSLILNTAVSLAEGEDITESVLDGIGGALPSQPTSGMAFHAAVAIGKGERIQDILVEIAPLDRSLKDVLKVADEVIVGIANGQAVTDVAYGTVRGLLPPDAQQGMDLARRVVNGEDIPGMFLTQAEQIALDGVKGQAKAILAEAQGGSAEALSIAQSKVDAIYNQYAAEFGYQMALDELGTEATGWLQMGLAGGGSLRAAALAATPFVGTFGSIAETNTIVNDGYAQKGEELIASGIKFNNRPVADIRSGDRFDIVIDFYDLLNDTWTPRLTSYRITDAWRRGFTIAIGVCEGSSIRGPGQLDVYQTMAEIGGRDGFNAGQAVQHGRTLHGDSGLLNQQTTQDESKPIPRIVPEFVNLSPQGAQARAARERVTVQFLHSQSADDIFGEDLQSLLSGDGDRRAYADDEIIVNVQRPAAGETMDSGGTVSLGVALASGVS